MPRNEEHNKKTSVSAKIDFKIPIGNLSPERENSMVSRVARTSGPVDYLKNLYSNVCQICSTAVDIGHDRYYSEVHHIQPLGKHLGPDILENMIVVCPNHHAMFDRGALTINVTKKTIQHSNPKHPLNGKRLLLKHDIGHKYIEYHNRYIFDAQKASKADENLNYGHFGKRMILTDLTSKENFEIQFEPYLQREFMTTLQRAALYRSPDEQFECEGYSYRVVRIIENN